MYSDRVLQRVKANIVVPEDIADNPSALVSVRLAADGSRLSARLSMSSGGAGWDNAALRVLARSDPFPRDENGKGPDSFIITFRPND
ncbi:hypothetical protein OR16_12500 [Cupriavidus basilensis OR16]|uniref:Uncharacterized protein n=1 Tax=Cupriavidus basilensis OR16 TaxID=1127483 RepID=H1S420_9BURK|nr:hypothetical protein OR16_12500 [Cupriavidus basilensis OR16]